MLDRRKPLKLVLNEVGEDTILVIPDTGITSIVSEKKKKHGLENNN